MPKPKKPPLRKTTAGPGGRLNHRTVVGQRRRARTEARIIEAALHVFAEKGLRGAVIDDFIKAAGIARGTFYNYFPSIGELLLATRKWLNDDLVQSIEDSISDIDDPITRFGVGIRLWMRRAASDRAWCGFVSQLRLFGTPALEKPLRDIKRALRARQIDVPSMDAAMDLVQGAKTYAMYRMLTEPRGADHGNNIAILILQGLGVNRKTIAEIMRRPLPEFRRQPMTIR